MKRFAFFLLAGIAAVAVARDAPYQTSSDYVCQRLLELAQVTSNDTVYDLGSGDGRIVIMAAKAKGAHGVGVEIDPELVEKSRQNAEFANVTDLVTFRTEDIFTTNIASATVVTLYLLQSTNLRLRPKLLAELKPGTRVVSHEFDMGDWVPLKQERLGGRSLYLWVVPERPKNAASTPATP